MDISVLKNSTIKIINIYAVEKIKVKEPDNKLKVYFIKKIDLTKNKVTPEEKMAEQSIISELSQIENHEIINYNTQLKKNEIIILNEEDVKKINLLNLLKSKLNSTRVSIPFRDFNGTSISFLVVRITFDDSKESLFLIDYKFNFLFKERFMLGKYINKDMLSGNSPIQDDFSVQDNMEFSKHLKIKI